MRPTLIVAALAAASLTAAAGQAGAQPYGGGMGTGGPGYGHDHGGRPGGWDAGRFWAGAPAGPYERIEWLRQRIHRGIEDGSLNRGEAMRAIQDLRSIEVQARSMTARDHGHLNGPDRGYLQDRLDHLSRGLRWAEHNDR